MKPSRGESRRRWRQSDTTCLSIGSGMACCPFHNDRTPSMKLYPDHFHCFGCGQTGDVIDLTAQLTGQNARDAAGRLATDFGIPMQTGEDTAPRPGKMKYRTT